MVDLLVGPQGNLDPKVYLLIFLKFIQVVWPGGGAWGETRCAL